MADGNDRDIASPSHQRAPFSDPLADGVDPTSPGAPHEPGGSDYRQSDDQIARDTSTDSETASKRNNRDRTDR